MKRAAAIAIGMVAVSASPPPPVQARLGSLRVGATATTRVEITRPLLALAFVAGDRLFGVTSEEVLLFDAAAECRILAREPLPAPVSTVRKPAVFLSGDVRSTAVWMVRTGDPGARLVETKDARLAWAATAEAAPFPGASQGLSFRAGTNLLEGSMEGAERASFVAADAASGIGVTGDGGLAGPGVRSGPRVGDALAALWQGWLVTSGPNPRDSSQASGDSLLFLEAADGDWTVAAEASIEAPVDALAARIHGGTADVAVAFHSASGNALRWFSVRREP